MILRILFVTFSVVYFCIDGKSCSCDAGPLTKSEFNFYDFIFIGKVVSFAPISENEAQYGGSYVAEFLPYKTYKSKLSLNDTLSIECDPHQGCGSSFSVGYYYFVCNYGYSSMCDHGTPLNVDPTSFNFKKYLVNFITEISYRYNLEQMQFFYEKYGSLEKYCSNTVVTDIIGGRRKDFYRNEIPFGVDPDTVNISRPISQSTFYHGERLDGSQLDSIYTYHNNGNIKSTERFKNGETIGWKTDYREDGNYQDRIFYNENGKYIIYEQYVENGILFYKSIETDSLEIYYSYNEYSGSLEKISTRDSTGILKTKLYRPDGSVYCEGHQTFGRTDVRQKESFFYIDNYTNIKGEQVVINGSGHFVEWYNDTLKLAEGELTDGVFHGHVRRWYENGVLNTEGFFEMPGEKLTYWLTLVEKLSDSNSAKYGYPIGVHRTWLPDGTLYFEDIYVPGAETHLSKSFWLGEWREYYSEVSRVYD